MRRTLIVSSGAPSERAASRATGSPLRESATTTGASARSRSRRSPSLRPALRRSGKSADPWMSCERVMGNADATAAGPARHRLSSEFACGKAAAGARPGADGPRARRREDPPAMTATLAPPPPAALGRRAPEFIRRTAPLLSPLLRAWFRPEVRGLERIPPTGPVLLVGNHSGGNVSPDTLVLTLAFTKRFGPERPFFQLAHDLVLAMPWLRVLPRYGTVAAAPATARAALASGAAGLRF